MRQIKNSMLLSMAAILALTFAFAVPASAKMVKKVDNFILFLDHSGSMGMTNANTGEPKIDMAKKAMKAMNDAIPSLDYKAAFFTFAPFEKQSAPMMYNKQAIANAVADIDTDFPIFGRQTALGDGQADVEPVIGSFSGKTALIMFTDGQSNIGSDPVAAAKALRSRFGNNLCVHIVSLADTPKGEQTIEAMRSVFPCSVATDYESLMAPGAMDRYAKDVFYEEVADAPAMAEPEPAPAPAPAVVPMAKETITFNLNFGFDKAAVTDDMTPILEQVVDILQEDPEATFTVSGHTDSTGPEAYNQGLSERRAAAVVNWLTNAGIDASRLESAGYGELQPKYDNATREGRRLNRRVELQTN